MSEDLTPAVRRAYRDAVLALPSQTRSAFLEHRVEGASIETIAARHALSVEAVILHLAEALVAIDRALQALGPEGPPAPGDHGC